MTDLSLTHPDSENTDDATLEHDAQMYFAKRPRLQVIAEILAALRAAEPEWWSAAFARDAWPPLARMRWLRDRADVRQRITSELTGLSAKTARSKSPEFQAELIEAALRHGDISLERLEAAFRPIEMVVYGPFAEIWTEFRKRLPWNSTSPNLQALLGTIVRSLLAERSTLSDSALRRAVLSPTDLRGAIPARTWHECIPIELRVAVDEARIKFERSRQRDGFQSRHELAIVTPDAIATNIPIAELVSVFDCAEKAMGLKSEADEGDATVTDLDTDFDGENATSERRLIAATRHHSDFARTIKRAVNED